MSNLRLRVISAIVLAVVVLAITWLGGVTFRILAAAIAAAMFYEWCAMSRRHGNARDQIVAAILLAAVLIAVILDYFAASILILLMVSVIACILQGWIGGQGSWIAAGLAYAGLSGISIAFLRGGDQAGLVAIIFLFAVVWATDILAYFVGRSLGGPKLAPSISPGKTQSGALGGTVGGILAGLLAALAFGVGNLPLLALVALVLSVVSQAGDLFKIMGQAASWREGFGLAHPRPRRRDGPRGRTCCGRARPLCRGRLAGRHGQSRASFVCELIATDSPLLGRHRAMGRQAHDRSCRRCFGRRPAIRAV